MAGKLYEMNFVLGAKQNSGFKSTFSQAQAEFARLGGEIQSLNRIQADISAYQKQQSAIDSTTKKEDSIMDGKTFKKMYDEINPTYNTLEEVPSYWRADIKELVDKGIISGVGGGKLGLTKRDCKAAVIAKRIKEKL